MKKEETGKINFFREKGKYFIEDVLAAGHTLEPLHCKFCGSAECTYHQYIEDAYCPECGEWQLDE